jgi:hypothetical protein
MATRIMILLIVVIAASSCAKINTLCTKVNNLNAMNDFEKSAKKYNQMLRWHELDMAGLAFADESLKEAYAERAKAAKGVKIADYRVVLQECAPETKTAKVVLDIDYYIPPSVTLKSVEDVQRWEYVDINDKKTWKLKSLLPEFK